MSIQSEQIVVSQLKNHDVAELKALLLAKADDFRKLKFSHAKKQLRQTHQLRVMRRDMARLRTIIGQREENV